MEKFNANSEESLIQKLDKWYLPTQGSQRAEIMNLITNKIAEAGNNGNESAVKLACQELYNGTAGQWLTADEFVEGIFAKSNINFMYLINESYNKTTGSDLRNDIQNDMRFSGIKNLLLRRLDIELKSKSTLAGNKMNKTVHKPHNAQTV